MTHRSYPREAGFAETLGLILGGGALVAVLAGQVLFVAWML